MRNTPRDHQLVSKGEKRLLVSEGEGADARERSEHHAVGGHSPEDRIDVVEIWPEHGKHPTRVQRLEACSEAVVTAS